jgi:hypothetical protein
MARADTSWVTASPTCRACGAELPGVVLGPWGGISLMVALVATLPAAGLFGMFMYAIWFPVILIVGLRGIWAKG